MNIFNIKQLIPNSDEWIFAEEITYGWSGEQKYKITDKKHNMFLLRILSHEQFNEQLQAIKFLQKCNQSINNIPKIYSFGNTRDNLHSYVLLDYIPGDNGMNVIKDYNTNNQYVLGYKIGKTLLAIHNINNTKKYKLQTKLL